MSEPPMATTSEFPQFRFGDVLITLRLGGQIQNFKLHSDVLAQGSGWFHNFFYQNQADRGMYHFSLDVAEGTAIPLLEKSFDKSRDSTPIYTPPMSPPQSLVVVPSIETPGPSNGAPQIKIEEGVAVSSQPLPGEIILAAYNHMFSAILYAALPVVRPHIGNIISQYRQDLWVAIKDNPPRWLKFAISLENAAIYAEALIHMVGAYPTWPWLTARRSMPPNILPLVEKKSKELNELCLEAEHDLFLNALLKENGQPVHFTTEYETWMATQVFRDYISSELHAAVNTRGLRMPNKIGRLYRKLKKGGDAYLPYDEVLADLETARQSDWMELADDLKQLKEFAKVTVEAIARNRLILDVEEHDVGYLTSTTIVESDIPWLKSE